MPGSNDPRRASGANWPGSPPTPLPQAGYVTSDHFNTFVDEFRGVAHQINEHLNSMDRRMAAGATQFALQEAELRAAKARLDDHSDKITILDTDKTSREAGAAATAEANAPRRAIVAKAVELLVTAVVLGALAVGYNAWRDQELAASRDQKSTSTTARPPALSPAP